MMKGPLFLLPSIKGAASQSADLLDFLNSAGTVLSKVDSASYITLPGVPTAALHAATKSYVDAAITAGSVTSFNSRIGAVTLTSSDVTTALTYTPLKNVTDTMTGNFTVTGSVGIGTIAPTSHLSVVTADATPAMKITTSYDVTTNGYTWFKALDQAGRTRIKMYSASDGGGGVNNLRIDSAVDIYLGPGGGGSESRRNKGLFAMSSES